MRSAKKRVRLSAPRSAKSGSRDAKIYSKRDVEVLVEMALAGARLAEKWRKRR